MDLDFISGVTRTDTILELPDLPVEYLGINFLGSEASQPPEDEHMVRPFANSEVFSETEILNAKELTYGDDVKEVYLIELPSYGQFYEPGDTIAILPYNSEKEVTQLFRHLNISHLAHKNCIITENIGIVKGKLKPVFVDKPTTLYNIFKNEIDIRCIPKKSLIRLMAEYTRDRNERIVLQKLCCKGANRYKTDILEKGTTFIDLLICFPSCVPPIIRLIENLPMLLPRPYSIASSCLSSPNRLRIVFTVASSVVNGIKREGICTGMLKSIIKQKDTVEPENLFVRMYYRKPNGFRLPKETNNPIILIGTGSGVAPFIGFLEYRKIMEQLGTVWLFYGCRYKKKDYLFREELEDFLNCNALTKLITSFSREPDQDVKYVQDNLKKYGKEVCDMIYEENALIYVCGDAKRLNKDLIKAFVEILQNHKGLSIKEATVFIKNLQKWKRYLQDIWL